MRVFVVLLFLTACGGARSSTTAAGSSERSGETPEAALQLCARDTAERPRTDYSHIASYRCADGSTPLEGIPDRGAAARLRNVGPGPDGHVVDLYEVPCASGAVRIHVDAYHCGPGVDMEVDPNNLDANQLRHMAQGMRALETEPFDPQASELRGSMMTWLRGSPQVHLSICPAVIEEVVREGYRYRELILSQFILSMGAAVIELSDRPEHSQQVALAAVVGALRLYQAIIERRPDGVEPHLSDLVRRRDELRERVATLVAQCDRAEPSMGMVMSTDAGNVWPPSGPQCERLVRCCEERGFVRGGAAVTGTPGLMCLLSASPPDVDCAAGLAMLEVQGVECPP